MTAGRLTAACVQICSGPDPAENVAAACALAREARAEGAELIALPETVALIEPDFQTLAARSPVENAHPALAAFSDLAAGLGCWLLVGSLAVGLGGDRLANRSLLLDGRGRVRARYDKIHLFDVELPDGRRYRESARYRPGTAACLAQTPWGPIGMTICYDLRFPGLYLDLARAGAGILTVPSAFTETTGGAHWHVLLRARAIETGCYVLAPAQCGEHAPGRRSYGHSLIVDPWGRVLADGGVAPGFVAAEIDLSRVAAARAAILSLEAARPYAMPSCPRAAFSPRERPSQAGPPLEGGRE